MKKEEQINIVYACNDAYANYLALSILSILRRTKSKINFYVLTANLSKLNQKWTSISKKSKDFLRRVVKEYSPKSTISFFDCSDFYFKYFKRNKNEKARFSPYTTLRLFIDKALPKLKRVEYLDVDILACGDVKEFLKINIDNYDFAATLDWKGLFFQFWRRRFFNAGVLSINIKNVIKNKIFDKAINLINTKRLQLVDQDALWMSGANYLFIKDYKYNYQKQKLDTSCILKHFNNLKIKPWTIDLVHKKLKYTFFDNDYKEWERIQKFWKKS